MLLQHTNLSSVFYKKICIFTAFSCEKNFNIITVCCVNYRPGVSLPYRGELFSKKFTLLSNKAP